METVEIWRNGRYHPVQVEVVVEKLTDANGLVLGQETVRNPEAVEAQLPPIDPAQMRPPPASERRGPPPLPPRPPSAR